VETSLPSLLNNMGKINRTAIFGCLFMMLFPSAAFGDTLTTENYIVTISRLCPEGFVSCDNVKYVGVSRKSGNKIELDGGTLHTMCADGKTPCHFQGYEFMNGDITYRVLERGVLQVIQGGSRVLLEEEGVWDY